MKIIDILACPNDYKCWACVNFENTVVTEFENTVECKFDHKTGFPINYRRQRIKVNGKFVLCEDYIKKIS